MTSRAEAAETIASDIINEGVGAVVYSFPPAPQQAQMPHVAIVYTGATDTEFQFEVHVVVAASQPTVRQAYATFLDLVQRVDEALDASGWGPPGDSANWQSTMDAWIATYRIDFPRDDF
jgi:hypothetical protein